jgi:hypothetical protein
MFKVLVNEACDPSLRSQLLREFASKPAYAIFPAPSGSDSNVQHQNLYLARCLTHQLATEDLNDFLRADPVSPRFTPPPLSTPLFHPPSPPPLHIHLS